MRRVPAAEGRKLWACFPQEPLKPIVIIFSGQGAILSAHLAKVVVRTVPGVRATLRPKIETAINHELTKYEVVFRENEICSFIGENIVDAMGRQFGENWREYFAGPFPTGFRRPDETLKQFAAAQPRKRRLSKPGS